MHNAEELTIGTPWNLNLSQAIGLTKQATSMVVSVNPNNVPILLPALFLLSEGLKVEKTTEANHYTPWTNCYRFRHASPRCTQKHPPAPTVRFMILSRLTDVKTTYARMVPTPRPSQAAAPPPPATALTAMMTTMPSPGNAGLHQSPLLNPRPPHLPNKNYPTPPPTGKRPWKWAIMAT